MGLFSNKKKLCPLCGEPTPRLFSTKVEDMPICKECAGKIDLPMGMINDMSLADVEKYMTFYEENQPLHGSFTETYRYDSFSGVLVLDTDNRLFRLNGSQTGLVMEHSNLKKFRILEGSKVLFEGTANSLKSYESDVPERVRALEPTITQYRMELQHYEHMEQRRRREEERAKERGEQIPHRYIPRPTLNVKVPFERFYIELVLEHPYWKSVRWEKGAPTFSYSYPSAEGYIQSYEEMAEELHVLALNMMQVLNPMAQEVHMQTEALGAGARAMVASKAASVQETSENDVIEQLQKYKGLLDAGIITEEEFTAKKRQLLEI